jgi:hypothetical protein
MNGAGAWLDGAGVASAGALAAAMGAYGWLLERLRRSDRAEATRWWFGYARDGVNLGVALVDLALLRAAGFSGPSALVLAVALVLAGYLLDWTLGRWRPRPSLRRGAIALVAALSLASALAAARIDPLLRALVDAAAP